MNAKKIFRHPVVYVLLIAALLITGFSLFSAFSGPKHVTVQEGFELLSEGNVAEAKVTDGDQRVDLTLTKEFKGTKNVQFYYVGAREEAVIDAVAKANPKDGYDDAVPQGSIFGSLLSLLIPILLLGLLFWFLLSSAQGGGKMAQFGKSRAKNVTKENPDVTFADVAGSDEAVGGLQEMKDFLSDPTRFQALGAKIPKGVLRYRPHGTGKTLLAC